ncbi:MAG: CsbD family protein [Panacagrimonas sp.]
MATMNNPGDRNVAKSPAADKAKGHTKEVIGKVKSKVGEWTDDRDLQAEGYADRAEGKGDRMKGEIKEKIDDAKTAVKSGVKAVKEKVQEARRDH